MLVYKKKVIQIIMNSKFFLKISQIENNINGDIY